MLPITFANGIELSKIEGLAQIIFISFAMTTWSDCSTVDAGAVD